MPKKLQFKKIVAYFMLITFLFMFITGITMVLKGRFETFLGFNVADFHRNTSYAFVTLVLTHIALNYKILLSYFNIKISKKDIKNES